MKVIKRGRAGKAGLCAGVDLQDKEVMRTI